MINMIVKIKRKVFALEGSVGSKVVNLSLLGPLLLLFSFSLVLLRLQNESVWLLLAIWIGFFCTKKWKWVGYSASLLLLLAAHLISLNHFSMWQIALSSSVALSLFITLLSFHEAKNLFFSWEEDSKTQAHNIAHLNALLKSSQFFVLQERKEAQRDIEEMKMRLNHHIEQIKNNCEEKEKLLQELLVEKEKSVQIAQALEIAYREIEHLKQKEEQLEAQEGKLLDNLNDTRTDLFQLAVLNDAYALGQKEKESRIAQLSEELKGLSHTLKEAKNKYEREEEKTSQQKDVETLYKMLKGQFKEKSDVLHQTRKELFQLEGKFLGLQKEHEHKALEADGVESSLVNHIKVLEEECNAFEEEIFALHEVITNLISKKRVSRPRKKKTSE